MLTPQEHESISKLQYFARHVVEGVTVGRHRSAHKGASVEFKEHRQYTRGDEIRSIDWKLFGKTDRLFIRQYEDETNLRSMILLDQSGSMAYEGSRSNFSKHLFSVRLAACLATLFIWQQDAVGLATLDTELREIIPPRRKPSHLQMIFRALVTSKTGGETRLSAALQQAARQLKRNGLLVLISDCFDHVEDVMTALRYFRHTGSEVVVFQIWDADELDFPFRHRTQFRSLESASHVRLVDPNSLRPAYLQRVAAFRQQLSRATAQERIDLVHCTTDQDFTDILSAYLSRRSSLA